MNRKLIRPSLPGKRQEPKEPGRRASAPGETRAEAAYLVQAIESGVPFQIELLGGDSLTGRLEGYDRDVLILARDGVPSVVVRREQIRRYAMRRPAPSP